MPPKRNIIVESYSSDDDETENIIYDKVTSKFLINWIDSSSGRFHVRPLNFGWKYIHMTTLHENDDNDQHYLNRTLVQCPKCLEISERRHFMEHFRSKHGKQKANYNLNNSNKTRCEQEKKKKRSESVTWKLHFKEEKINNYKSKSPLSKSPKQHKEQKTLTNWTQVVKCHICHYKLLRINLFHHMKMLHSPEDSSKSE